MRRVVALELMDDPGVDARELAGNFDDIERANRYFGGTRPVVAEVLARDVRRVLDVGCGSADIARALSHTARARGRTIEIVGLDSHEAILALARARTSHDLPISFVRADGARLPFGDRAFDIATCSLALHHFEPAAAVALLRELRRVSALTPLVCDLVRSRIGLIATSLFARFIATNRLSKHDAPLSVRRAYTPDEALALARDAGWTAPHVRRLPYFRMMLCDGG
ncbi:MAG: class I SAM-dependent methyltransferase [Vulcanimicrobiaceae bacterium]